jgi:hypothetical protein
VPRQRYEYEVRSGESETSSGLERPYASVLHKVNEPIALVFTLSDFRRFPPRVCNEKAGSLAPLRAGPAANALLADNLPIDSRGGRDAAVREREQS